MIMKGDRGRGGRRPVGPDDGKRWNWICGISSYFVVPARPSTASRRPWAGPFGLGGDVVRAGWLARQVIVSGAGARSDLTTGKLEPSHLDYINGL
jgi:hypothetical protein